MKRYLFLAAMLVVLTATMQNARAEVFACAYADGANIVHTYLLSLGDTTGILHKLGPKPQEKWEYMPGDVKITRNGDIIKVVLSDKPKNIDWSQEQGCFKFYTDTEISLNLGLVLGDSGRLQRMPRLEINPAALCSEIPHVLVPPPVSMLCNPVDAIHP